jgi:hypothetical protein
MTTTLNAAVAQEHVADLRRAAQREAARVQTTVSTGRTDNHEIVALRLAGPDDADALRGLAELDGAPTVPVGEVLLAVIDGEPVAALSLRDDQVVSNPFRHTADAVALLRVRARHLGKGKKASRRSWWPLRPRFA